MTIRRTFDPTFLNEVVNHAEVRPWLGQDRASRISMDALIANPDNVALVNDHGGFIYVMRALREYEVHTQFLPRGRGASAVTAAKASLRYMFDVMNAKLIVTDVPDDNSGAMRLALGVGFEHVRDRFDEDGRLSGVEQFIHELELTRQGFLNASKGWTPEQMPVSEMVAVACQLH